eukprot:76419-Chlamydomonas_euryale.AAC.3
MTRRARCASASASRRPGCAPSLDRAHTDIADDAAADAPALAPAAVAADCGGAPAALADGVATTDENSAAAVAVAAGLSAIGAAIDRGAAVAAATAAASQLLGGRTFNIASDHSMTGSAAASSWLTATSSWLAAASSQLTPASSCLIAVSSWLTAASSWLTAGTPSAMKAALRVAVPAASAVITLSWPRSSPWSWSCSLS